MKYIALFIAFFLPAIAYADAAGGSSAPQSSVTMVLFIFGSVTSMMFIKGRQNPDFHTGIIPIFQSVVIAVCFLWSHYILLIEEHMSLIEFYSNFFFHIDKALLAFICVILLYAGFVAVIICTVKIAYAMLKKPRK